MGNGSFFIAIEGLDGSGKTTIARQLAYFMQSALKKSVKLTFEPHDPSCGGLFIRQVLEKKIRDFSHETLMLAFAANRLDHCDREITAWLSKGNDKIVICDRYYLSSLVYQTNENFDCDYVMNLNSGARKPDLTIFMNVSNKVCYERMKIRNKPKELFERNLTKTREKYFEAIDYLRNSRNEKIEVVDASGSMKEVLEKIVKIISGIGSEYRKEQLSIIDAYSIASPKVFVLNGDMPNNLKTIVDDTINVIQEKKAVREVHRNDVKNIVEGIFNGLEFNDKGILFFNYILNLGYKLIEKLPWTHLDAYELEYSLPGGITQRGTALLINENQRYDVILGSVSNLQKMTDFMFVFSPGPSELVTKYYERDIVKNKNNQDSLFPSTDLVTESDLVEEIVNMVWKHSDNHHLV